MAFIGLICGMVVGAIAASFGVFFLGIPLWLGLLTYSFAGAATMLLSIAAMYARHDDDDSGHMPRFERRTGYMAQERREVA